MFRYSVVMIVMLATGCASVPAEKVTVTYELDQYAVAYPVVNGETYKMTDAERRRQVQLIVNEYCKAD